MPKPDLNTYNPYEKWSPSLHRAATFLAGSPLALMSVAIQHQYPESASNPTSLHKRLMQGQQGNVTWPLLHYGSVSNIFKKLQSSELLGVPNDLNTTMQEAIERADLIRAVRIEQAAYAGVVLKLCNDTGQYPQVIIGKTAKRQPGKEIKTNSSPVARLGLYALLGTSEEQFSMTEIDRVLDLQPGDGVKMIGAPVRHKVLALEKGNRVKPSLVQFTDEYREPMMNFSAGLDALATEKGIENGLREVESALKDPARFSAMMAFGANSPPREAPRH